VTTGPSDTARLVLPTAANSWGPSWSPDGRALAFYADQGGVVRVWVSTRRAAARPVSAAVQPAENFEVPVWTPDGRQLVIRQAPAVLRDRGDHAAAPLRGALANSTADSALRVGATVVVYHSPSSGRPTLKPAVNGPSGDAASDSTEVQPANDDWLGDLALLDVTTGQIRVLAPRVRSIWYRLAPDGRRLAFLDYQGKRVAPSLHGEPTFATYVSKLVVLDLATARTRVVMPHVEQYWYPIASWSPDGRWLATLSGSTVVNPGSPGNYSVRGDLFAVPSAGGPSRPFRGAPAHAFGTMVPPQLLWDAQSAYLYLSDEQRIWRATVATRQLTPVSPVSSLKPTALVQVAGEARIWSPDGDDDALYLLTSDSLTVRAGIYRLQPSSGTLTQLREEDKLYVAGYVMPPLGARTGDRVIFQAESEAEGEDLWIGQSGFAQLRRLTTLNPQLASYRLGTTRLIEFHSTDGMLLRGTLLLPADYVPGRRYPLVTVVYPGGLGSKLAHYFDLSRTATAQFNMQLLSTRGYAVLYPDMPVQEGTVMSDLMKGVMPAIDHVVALGIANPERLAVMGHSAGGYATLGLLVQTRRFKAAVATDGVSNLSSFYGSLGPTGEGTWTSYLETVGGPGGAPWQVPQRYIENSPIFHLDRIQTPLLLGVGGADEEFVAQMNEVFVGLQRLGREATYVRYEGEGHFLVQVPNLTDYWTRVLAFYERHLR